MSAAEISSRDPRAIGEGSARSRPGALRRFGGYALLAALSYIPVLLSDPGRVAADTKSYLSLDVGRLMERAWSMWDPNIGLGTVTHQNIGYLFPMGPFYWVLNALGASGAVTQRIWLGTIIFAAGLGMLYLFRTLDVRGPGAVVGALAFMLSPYLLDYAARISVILLPWAGLPWLLAFTILALRKGGWRYPALIAITVQIVGGVNATSLIFAGVAPALWLPWAVWGSKEVSAKRMFAALARIGVLTATASLWWLSGLWAQGNYGIDILKFTETVRTVAKTSTAPEVLRGLGYWFLYGQDKIGPWIESALPYTQSVTHIAISFAVPALALLCATCIRWRHRSYFVLLAFVGATIGIGAYSFDDPSPLGGVLKLFATSSSLGLALRSTGRATPLVVLAFSVFLALGVSAGYRAYSARGRGKLGVISVALIGVLVIANLPALWQGTFYGKNLQRSEQIPKYWSDALAEVNKGSLDSRVLELPGSDFGSYRWGSTVDPITPGLIDRPYVARELIPYGTPASADLLNAYDRRLQEGLYESVVTAPFARLLGVDEIVVRNDLQTDRYNLIRPRQVWREFKAPQSGLEAPQAFGSKIPGAAFFPQIDEQALAFPANEGDPPPVAVVRVTSPLSIVRTKSVQGTVIIAGDGEGIIDAAASGVIDGHQLVRYAASMTGPELQDAAKEGATLVITDTNRKRARRWSTVRDNLGYTEQAGEKPLAQDLSDARLEVFPGARDNSFTVVEQQGVKRVVASAYGNPITYTAEDRAAMALDGNLDTAWRVGAFSPVIGERILVEAKAPITTNHFSLVQPLTGPRNRWITSVKIRFDGKGEIKRVFDDSSRTSGGQRISFPSRKFRSIEIIVDGDSTGKRFSYEGLSGVGISELTIGSGDPVAEPLRVVEVTRVPTDLLERAGVASARQDLVILLTRERNTPVPPRAGNVESALSRSFALPTPRTFTVGGVARINPASPTPVIDSLLGASTVTATESEHLAGDARFRSSSAIDGDPLTAWNTPFVGTNGQWIEFHSQKQLRLSSLDMRVVADGRHSVPTKVTLSVDGKLVPLSLPPIKDQTSENATSLVHLDLPSTMSGQTLRLTIDEVRETKTKDFYGGGESVMPVGIAELGAASLVEPSLASTRENKMFSTPCRDDLLSIDGKPVNISILGSRSDALSRGGLRIIGCDEISLGAGRHTVNAVNGAATALDLDRLDMRSLVSGSSALAATPSVGEQARTAGDRLDGPTVGASANTKVISRGRYWEKVRVTNATPREPLWIVLGQSQSAGWSASIDGESLGASKLVDGYANGWRLTPTSKSFVVTLKWQPQGVVNKALVLSLLAVLACLILAIWNPRRRKLSSEETVDDGEALLVAPWRSAQRPTALRASFSVVSVLLIGSLVAGPLVGITAALFVLVACLWPPLRAFVALAPSASLAAAGIYIAWRQMRVGVPPTFEWPLGFTRVHLLGWSAVVFLVADSILSDGADKPDS